MKPSKLLKQKSEHKILRSGLAHLISELEQFIDRDVDERFGYVLKDESIRDTNQDEWLISDLINGVLIAECFIRAAKKTIKNYEQEGLVNFLEDYPVSPMDIE